MLSPCQYLIIERWSQTKSLWLEIRKRTHLLHSNAASLQVQVSSLANPHLTMSPCLIRGSWILGILVLAILPVTAKLEILSDAVQFGCKGRDGILLCKTSSNARPKFDITWTFANGTEIQSSKKYKVRSKKLIIKNLQSSDMQFYRCTAEARRNNQWDELLINFIVWEKREISKLTVEIEPNTAVKVYKAGEQGMFLCKANAVSCGPKRMLKWFIDDDPVAFRNLEVNMRHSPYAESIGPNGLLLHIDNIQAGYNNSILKCTGTYNEQTSSDSLVLRVISKLWAYKKYETGYLGGVGNQHCKSLGLWSGSEFISFENGTRIQSSDKYGVSEHNLIIRNLTFDDTGNYRCTAMDYLTQQKVVDLIAFEVTDALKIKSAYYQIGCSGRTSRLECYTTSDAETIWSFDNGTQIQTNSKYKVKPKLLYIRNTTPSDTAKLKCTARNVSTNQQDEQQIMFLVMGTETDIGTENGYWIQISVYPPVQEVKAGESGQFTCISTASCYEPPPPTWYVGSVRVLERSGHQADPTIPYSVAVSSETSVLYFDKFVEWHNSTVKCQTAPDLTGTVYDSYMELRVITKLKILSNENQYGCNGQEGRLECKTSLTSTIFWSFANGSAIQSNDRYTIDQDTLTIKNVTFDDEKDYECIARFNDSYQKDPYQTDKLLINFQVIDSSDYRSMSVKLIDGSTDLKVKEFKTGEAAVFACVATPHICGMMPTLTWSMDDIPVVQNTLSVGDDTVPYTEAVSSNELLLNFDNFLEKHSSTVKCTGTVNNHTVSDSRELKVFTNLALVSDVVQTGYFGETGLLECKTSLRSRQIWSFANGTLIIPNNRFKVVQDGMIITNLRFEDSGSYICLATEMDYMQKAKFIIQFNIVAKLKISSDRNQMGCLGHPVILDCRTSPKSTIRWFFANGTRILPSNKYKIYRGGPLQIEDVAKIDQMNYTCEAVATHSRQTGRVRIPLEVVDNNEPRPFLVEFPGSKPRAVKVGQLTRVECFGHHVCGKYPKLTMSLDGIAVGDGSRLSSCEYSPPQATVDLLTRSALLTVFWFVQSGSSTVNCTGTLNGITRSASLELEISSSPNNDNPIWPNWNVIHRHFANFTVNELRGNRMYIFSKEAHDFSTDIRGANDLCKSAGGYLLELNSYYEQYSLERTITENREVLRWSYFTGATDTDQEDTWISFNSGNEITRNNISWRELRPDDQGRGQDCQALFWFVNPYDDWNVGLDDVACNRPETRFICEIEKADAA